MLKLSVLSPERRLVRHQSAQSVVLPTSEGQIEVLPGHVGIIGMLETGAFSYETQDGSKIQGVLSSGFFEVKNDEVTVLAETLELPNEIDVLRAKLAQQKAESALKEADLDEHKFKKYQLKLQRAMIRQQFADKPHGEG